MKNQEKKRLKELKHEIRMCGQIYEDPNWENFNEYYELLEKEIKSFKMKYIKLNKKQ
jgi:hypothetical protein